MDFAAMFLGSHTCHTDRIPFHVDMVLVRLTNDTMAIFVFGKGYVSMTISTIHLLDNLNIPSLIAFKLAFSKTIQLDV